LRYQRLFPLAPAVLALVTSSCGGRMGGPLNRIDRVAALPLQVAGRRLAVRLEGWVTLADAAAHIFFMEDGTGAARIELPFTHAGIQPGDILAIIGTVGEGGPAPTVVAAGISILPGRRELRAVPVSAAGLASGRWGFRYVEIEGVFRSHWVDRAGQLNVRIGAGGTAFEAILNAQGLPRIEEMTGARVRVRAVPNLSHDVYGHTTRVQLWLPRPEDLTQMAPAPAEIPVQTVREVASWDRRALPEGRLHLRGAVRNEGVQEGLRLTDASGSIRLREAPAEVAATGDNLDVLGFAQAGANSVELADAVIAHAGPPVRSVNQTELTTAAQVHALSPEDAGRSILVHVRAIVTYINPRSGVFFVQDKTGPTYAYAPRIKDLKVTAGDLVDLTGVTAPGQFAPIVSNAWAERISSGPLPAPAAATFDDLISGRQDSAWVQMEGIVQHIGKAGEPEDHVWLEWGEDRYVILVNNPGSRALPPPGSRVRVSGACATLFNTRRQILGIQLYVPSPDFVRILEPAPDPATLRTEPISELLRFSASNAPGHRVRVRGVVTLASPTGPSYIQDSGAGVKIVNHAPSDLKPGDAVDVLGFEHAGAFSPEIQDAEITRLAGGQPVEPAVITVDEALDGAHDSELVRIDALLVDQPANSGQNLLVLQSGGKIFNAALERGQLPALDRGSIVRATGICSIEPGYNLSYTTAKSLSVILRTADDVAVVRAAPLWTSARLATALGSMAGLMFAVLTWVAVLRRRVRLQTAVIQRKLEQEESLKKAAEQASRAKSEFLANMSHEIRTPLNGILGFSGLMAESPLNGDQRDCNEAVRASAESLLVVINDILDFSRIEAGRMELDSTDFSLRQCVEAALCPIRPLAGSKGLRVETRIDDGVPDWVRADPNRLRQILINLAGNAVKFTQKGGISVSASLAAGGAEGLRVQFTVADTGIGIPESQRAAIFRPFHQGDGSITRRFGGAGLGLAITSKLIGLMDGRIWIESLEGEGSTFFFTIPMACAAEPATAAAGESPRVRMAQQPLSILVAEDNPMNQRLIQRLLEKRGHRVTIAATGVAALDAWQNQPWDLVLMDVQMPDMDGLEAARRIRALEKSGATHVPMVAMTACAMKGDREKCLAAGLDSYISKPIQIAALDEMLVQYAKRCA
jgi:signal transduction histidine kinase/ActR/RegA family two-component response regulator